MAAYIDEDLNDPAKYFQVKAYAGSEGTDTISLDSDVMQPDMVWIKDRGTTAAHTIQDAVRGFNAANKLSSNHTSGENDSEGATWENEVYYISFATLPNGQAGFSESVVLEDQTILTIAATTNVPRDKFLKASTSGTVGQTDVWAIRWNLKD